MESKSNINEKGTTMDQITTSTNAYSYSTPSNGVNGSRSFSRTSGNPGQVPKVETKPEEKQEIKKEEGPVGGIVRWLSVSLDSYLLNKID